MRLQFSLENDNDTNITIDEDSINIEIKGIEDEIEETENSLKSISSIIDNLITIKQHIRKFGITKQMLHLVNDNNSLGSAIGLTLPHYESEEENIDQIDENELPDVEVVVEGLGEAIAKGFQWLIDKIKAFGKFLLDLLPFRKKKIENATITIKKENIVKEVKEELGKSWMEQAKEMSKVEDEIKKIEKDQADQNKILDELLVEAKKAVDALDKGLPSNLFKDKFYSKKDSDIIVNLFKKAFIEWNKGANLSKEYETDFDIEAINNLGLSAGAGKKKLYYISDAKALRFDVISIEEYVKKGYKLYQFDDEENHNESDWTLQDLEKLGDEIRGIYTRSEGSVKQIKNYETSLKSMTKAIDNNKDNARRLQQNVTELIKLFNDLISLFNLFADNYVKVTTYSKNAIIKKLVQDSLKELNKK